MIELTSEGGVARLLVNRPQVRNAIALSDWDAIADMVAGLKQPETRLLILSGAGGAFSAGADISEFAGFQADAAERVRFRAAMGRAMDAVAALDIPTIARVEGPCFGAGVALAMACDLRLADAGAWFAITPAKMGIGYPQGDVARLVELVGPGWAARILFTGQPIDAATAERIGLVEAVADRAGFDALVEAVLACDAGSIAMLKRGIALARRGVAADAEQDRGFDALLGSPRLAETLSRRRTAADLRAGGG